MYFVYGVLSVAVILISSLLIFMYLKPDKFFKTALNLARKKAGLVSKKVNIDKDLEVSYLDGGSGEVLVLLHGFGANKDIYLNFAEYLSSKYRVIIPDIIGFGDSSHPKEADYSPKEQAKRVHELLQLLNIDSAHFVGNSMGGQISVVYASTYVQNVKSLFLVSPAGIWSDEFTKLVQDLVDKKSNPLIARTTAEFQGILSLGMHHPPKIPKPLLNVLADERIKNADLEEKIFQDIFKYSVEDDLKKIKVKTLILFGEYDKIIVPKTAKKFEEFLENSSTVILPNCGHVATHEKPKLCSEYYLKFLDEL